MKCWEVGGYLEDGLPWLKTAIWKGGTTGSFGDFTMGILSTYVFGMILQIHWAPQKWPQDPYKSGLIT